MKGLDLAFIVLLALSYGEPLAQATLLTAGASDYEPSVLAFNDQYKEMTLHVRVPYCFQTTMFSADFLLVDSRQSSTC